MVEHDFSFETLGVLLETLHQLRALRSLHVSRPVIHVGRRHELSAGREARDDDGFQVCARGVDGGGVTRGPDPSINNRECLVFLHMTRWWGRRCANSIQSPCGYKL